MPTPKQRPKSGTRKLSEVARHLVMPEGIVRTGWGPVRDTCRDKLGIGFDAWQDGCARIILAERADGKLAAMVGGVGMSFPRQVGKTYLLAGLIFGLCINRPGMLVIWSAHHARTHGETFLSMQAFAQRSKVAPYIEQIYTGSGDEEVRFHNGSRILFGARERGFGRGIPGVDILVMDEAQILSDKALENMLATLNTSQFGLQLYIGTPPKPEDNSEAFTRMRDEARSGEADDSAWIECGADPGSDPDDREQWAKANPSYPHRTPAESIMRLRKKLKLDGFMREGLGVWDDDDQDDEKPLIFSRWADCAVPPPSPLVALALGVAADLDGTVLSLSAADGDGHLASLLLSPTTGGRATFVAEVARVAAERMVPVGIQEKGPAWFLKKDLEASGVEVVPVTFDEFIQAGLDLEDAVEAGDVTHGNYDDLNAAIARAEWQMRGDRRVLSRKSGEISSLEATVLARHLAMASGPLAVFV